ncbi:protein pigeon isoform X2 [Lingula anatina]|uniref:Protein pigeon isoform X2 n=1 Tax=Lingula anatina TaxID=7574 RepID=A0A1S3JEI8_LINAN|nr:protein pigeon isoform X2 [Lingula anatina]|eukprot:XP_013408304.1 protein pigeon isoform X2 [Lingula anatina]
MLKFTCCFDISKEFEHLIRATQNEQNVNPELSATVVGQEKDGIVLYTWDSKSQFSGDIEVTHVGIYDPVKQTNKVLFIHDKKLTIVGASINQEHSLLGTYKVFLAELQPQNNVFNLNIQRQRYVKVQFLYGQYRGFGETAYKESHMLVFLHKEAIGLYHIAMARMGDKGIMMSGQPKTEICFGKFAWAQWDMHLQRLYIIHHKKENLHGMEQAVPVLAGFQFQAHMLEHPFELMFDVILDLPIPQAKKSSSSTYLDLRLSHSIPDANMNLLVLSLPNGTVCLCHQQTGGFKSGGRKKHHDNTRTATGEVPLQYSVCMIHHGSILQCVVPVATQANAAKNRIFFTMHNECVLVFLPGHFVHLLNVSLEYEPSHHILFHDVAYPDLTEEAGVEKTSLSKGGLLTHLYREKSGFCLFESSEGKGYKLSINKECLQRMFTDCYTNSTKMAILNYVIIKTKDWGVVKQLIEYMCNDIASPEVELLMEEFLIASTYSAMRRQIERDQLQLLPFTSIDTARGQLEKNHNNHKLAQVTYFPMKHNVNMGRRHSSGGDSGQRARKLSVDDLPESLSRHFKIKQQLQVSRFDPRSVSRLLHAMRDRPEDFQKSSLSENHLQEPGRGRRVLKTLSMKFRKLNEVLTPKVPIKAKSVTIITPESTRQNSPETGVGNMPVLPGEEKEEEFVYEDQPTASTTTQQLSQHMSKYLKQDVQGKIQNLASEYVSCQFIQSKQLFHMLWSILNTQEKIVHLDTPSCLKDYELFQAMERYLMVTQDLAFPLWKGFHTFFTGLAFRCLDFSLFLQYVDSGILTLTPTFVEQVLTELEDNRETDRIKFQILSKLPKEESVQYFIKSGHPCSKTFLAEQYVQATLLDDPVPRSARSSASSFEGDDLSMTSSGGAGGLSIGSVDSMEVGTYTQQTFPPLSTLLKLLETKDPEFKNKMPRREMTSNVNQVDKMFIESTATMYRSMQQ